MNWTTGKIRSTFIDFFKSKEHAEVPSAPIVMKNDPTLMFTNAGMNQFKEYFLGNEKPEYRRVCDAQKCLRVSGKHNDLEEVGTDTYHHTMFEMLGNWSFGDYFKAEAIEWARELLIDVYGIDKDRLYVTVFGGDEKDGVHADDEAREIWKKFLPEDRIMLFDKKDNFWEMGASGPCGPASEIHVDLRSDDDRKKIDAKTLVNRDHPQVIEIWNLVFIEYNRFADGSLHPLPQKHVDTGMGLERLAGVLQGVRSNYDIDLFRSLIEAAKKITGAGYSGSDRKEDVAVRVIADHIRAVAFCIADGQLPSNTGAGYVVRRILRRALRYGFSFLGMKEPFIYKLVSALNDEMGEAYPELKKQKELIENVVREEEASFLRTLDKGIAKFNDYLKGGEKTVDGRFAFELYDTYGFPIDLTQLLAAENEMTVDLEGFDRALTEQKKRSQDAGAVDRGDWNTLRDIDEVTFTGYDSLETEARIARYRKITKKGKDLYQIVLDKTPFYPRGGGQVGDSGELIADGKSVKIIDTVKENNLIIHSADQLPENLEAIFTARVNGKKRASAARNHTATHLLHHVLRSELGEHVEQKGSLVHPDYLRFDFSHFQKPEPEELERIERKVNEWIIANISLEEKREVEKKKAEAMGALALFGEKYGDKVRVIKFGRSVELCGGTHVESTGAVGLFKITSEGSVASGVRRIEAVTGLAAYDFVNAHSESLKNMGEMVKNPKNPVIGLKKLLDENSELERQLERYKAAEKKMLKETFKRKTEIVNGISFFAETVESDPGVIKDVCFELKNEVKKTVLVPGNRGKKAMLSLFISPDLNEVLDAGKLIRQLAQHIKGGGGGRPFFATAGGADANGLDKAYAEMRAIVDEVSI